MPVKGPSFAGLFVVENMAACVQNFPPPFFFFKTELSYKFTEQLLTLLQLFFLKELTFVDRRCSTYHYNSAFLCNTVCMHVENNRFHAIGILQLQKSTVELRLDFDGKSGKAGRGEGKGGEWGRRRKKEKI